MTKRSRSIFEAADASKRQLTRATQRKIQGMYESIAKDFQSEYNKLSAMKALTASEALRKRYLEDLLNDLYSSIDSLNKGVQSTIQNTSVASATLVVDAQNKYLSQAGLTIKGAYAHVPRQVVENLLNGGVYEGKWSFSQAIWKNGSKTQRDIQEVVAKGLAANRTTEEIADDLVKYLKPNALKPWDWNKVYPGVSRKIDYNAQRMARTLAQHAFQQTMIDSMRYNPWCNGIVWHSANIHGRTCDICRELDGKVFDVEKLPLDHPNGLCYFEPELDNMNKIADDLADWVLDGKNEGINTYIRHAHGTGYPTVTLK